MVNSILTHETVILWWDIADEPAKNATYYIHLNGRETAVTNKTHVTLRGVAGQATVAIYTDAAKTALFYENTFTLPKKPVTHDVRAYGATGDGVTPDTLALQKAIDACGAGECVYVPAGTYLTGALHLHSNMELYVAEGAELHGSTNPADYLPRIWSRFEGKEMECYSSLLNLGNISDREGVACEHVLIHGGGKIFGGGRELAENVINDERARLEADPNFRYDAECENNNTLPGRVRPKLINMSCAKHVVIDNMDVGHGSCWNVHMIYCQDIVTCNTRFYSYDVWNGDGWDPDSSTRCTLFNCDFFTGDDCVAIKSGKNPEGNVIAKPCTEIRIFDCRASYGHSIAVGSEMSGGVDGVYIWDCDLSSTIFGLEVKATRKRGGYVKNIRVTRSCLSRVMMHAVGYNDDGIAAPTVPYFGDCLFEDVVIRGEACVYKSKDMAPCTAIELRGFEAGHEVANITFKDVTVDNGHTPANQTVSLQTLENINFINLKVR